MKKFKKIGLVFCEDDVWNRYKFEQDKINIREFDKEIYKKFNLILSLKVEDKYFYDFDLVFLKKLEIEGLKNGFIFDHYKNFKENCDYLIFFGLYKIRKDEKNLIKSNKKKILYIAEPQSVDRISYNKKLHKDFNKIFSNDFSFVDNSKYFFTTGIHNVCKENKVILYKKKRKLLCSFVTNRNLTGYKSTSSQKKRLIESFLKKIPNDFDLYGLGWEKYLIYKSDIVSRVLNKLLFVVYKNKYLYKVLKKKNKSYKGIAENKIATCGNYKFELVIENSTAQYRNTDRIISTFFSGTVPLYYGPDTIHELIPSNCFIDLQKFTSEDDAINFLENINDTKYMEYIKNIKNFIDSEKFFHFTAKFSKSRIVFKTSHCFRS